MSYNLDTLLEILKILESEDLSKLLVMLEDEGIGAIISENTFEFYIKE